MKAVNMKIFSSVIVSVALAIFATPLFAADDEKAPDFEIPSGVQLRLINALSAFSKNEQLSDDQLRSLLWRTFYGGRSFQKGGVGLMGGSDGRYIDINNDLNTVVIHNKEISFSSRAKKEIVVFQGNKAIGALPYDGNGSITLVDFRPHRIQYLSFDGDWGGIYAR